MLVKAGSQQCQANALNFSIDCCSMAPEIACYGVTVARQAKLDVPVWPDHCSVFWAVQAPSLLSSEKTLESSHLNCFVWCAPVFVLQILKVSTPLDWVCSTVGFQPGMSHETSI